jgi:hypothetical protein
VFTHLTSNLTERKSWRSAIVGISRAKSDLYEHLGSIFVDTSGSLELPLPIFYSEYCNNNKFSDGFKKNYII